MPLGQKNMFAVAQVIFKCIFPILQKVPQILYLPACQKADDTMCLTCPKYKYAIQITLSWTVASAFLSHFFFLKNRIELMNDDNNECNCTHMKFQLPTHSLKM
jgi:hypothetical protein